MTRAARSGRLAAVFVAVQMGAGATHGATFQGFEPGGGGTSSPKLANGRLTPTPSLRAHRLDGEGIRLDGFLDDPAWQQAETASGFSMHEPDRGNEPTEETVFKVAYDDDAIYFGVACFENDPSKISSTLTRRDRIDNSDVVSIYIDPYWDKTTGYNFRVNPHGVLEDYYMFNNGDRDRDWDTVWDARTHRDEQGWYVEMRIPFSSIRYRNAESMTWGLQIYRWMHGRGEDTGWVLWDKESRGFISRFGTITGIENVRPPRQFEVTPYVVGRSTDPDDPGPDKQDNFENLGADIKYGLTSDLTLNATILPDFGQVEADPSVLNLSPFETFFEEKRPFFIEGSRFFQHPDFNLFYSRRIGTGGSDGLSRIRVAGKITGKSASGISMAALVAASDIMSSDRTHQLFRTGHDETNYFVGRFGKEFHDGAHRVNVMQTAVVRPGVARRNAYTSGFDFDLNFHDRTYNIQGSVVGSILEPAVDSDGIKPANLYGTGGALDLRKVGGTWRGGWFSRWEGDKLRLNDLGFLSAPDEMVGGGWAQYRLTGDEETSWFTSGEVNVEAWGSMLYAGDRRVSGGGELLWEYDRFHHQLSGANITGWGQLRSFWSLWYGAWYDHEGTSQFVTRGGPLMTQPQANGLWIGGNSDFRKRLLFDAELELAWNEAGYRNQDLDVGMRWNATSWLTQRVELSFTNRHQDAQHINARVFSDSLQALSDPDNFRTSTTGGVGIGGVSYVFGELDTQTLDLTLRTDLLFSRNQSLELYMQPFLTSGRYRNARELVIPDSYALAPFPESGEFRVDRVDFNRANLNLNLVYRWEYRPGSTLFLVWTHSRSQRERRLAAERFRGSMRPRALFETEPENVFLAKLTYWFAL